MNRSLERIRCLVGGVRAGGGDVVVATSWEHPRRGVVRCSAAPVLATSLRRMGRRVRHQPVTVGIDEEGDRLEDAVFCAASYLDRDGRAVGFGAAASVMDPAAVAAARDAVDSWSAVLRTHRVMLATPGPLCAGALRALEVVEQVLAQVGVPIYVLGRLVDNPHLAAELTGRGVVFVAELDAVPDHATVIFPAHGVTLAARAEAAARGLWVVDATCGLVAGAHEAARSFADRADTVVLIGRSGHAAVAGFIGQAPEATVLVQTVTDVDTLDVADPQRLSFVVQTGVPIQDAVEMVAALRSRFPKLRGQHPDGFCYAASDRREAVRSTAAASDLVLVLGAPDSADSRALAEIVRTCGTEARLLDTMTEIRPHWLTTAATIGLAVAATARPAFAEAVIDVLSGLGPLSVIERRATSRVLATSHQSVPV